MVTVSGFSFIGKQKSLYPKVLEANLPTYMPIYVSWSFFLENMLAIPNWYQIQSYNMVYITIVFTIILICSAFFIYQHKDIPNFGQPHPCIMQSENQYLYF